MTDLDNDFFLEHLDTHESCLKVGLRGRFGYDWYAYKDGAPPRDEFNDWIWNGYRWTIVNGPLRECD